MSSWRQQSHPKAHSKRWDLGVSGSPFRKKTQASGLDSIGQVVCGACARAWLIVNRSALASSHPLCGPSGSSLKLLHERLGPDGLNGF